MRIRLLLLLVLVASEARAGGVGPLVWPSGPPPCNQIANLQACVDTAPSGAEIEIAANAIPAQSVTISSKSLTLRPALGFTPVFASFTNIVAVGGDVNVAIVIEGLTIERGSIDAIQGGEGTFDVILRGNWIQATSSFNTALEVRSGNTQPPYGPTLFRVEGNRVDINVAATDQVSAISVGSFEGGVNVGTISRNVIRQVGGDQNAAISLANGNAALQVDVIGNQISGSNFNSGVSIFQFAPGGSTSARIINNTISGQVNDAGAPAGISLNVSQGNADFTVLSNTVAFNQRGLLFGGRPDLGATASALIANNIVAFNGQGINMGDFDATTVNEFNVVFGNGGNSFVPGPSTILADPLFVSPTNLRLRSGSAARDAGDNAQVPPDITTDVIGSSRIRDGVVDIGAFEDGDDYLLLSEQCGGSTAHLPAVLADLGLSAFTTTDVPAFGAALTSGTSWDLVLIDEYANPLAEDVRVAIRTYIAGGGHIYANYWDWDAQTATSFGATLGSSFGTPPELNLWDGSHPVLSDPETVSTATSVSDTCGTDAWSFEPDPGARAIAGYSGAPALNQAGLIVANGGRSILLGITPGLYSAEAMQPLLRNAIRFLLSPDILLLDGQCNGSASHFPVALGGLDLAFQHTTTGVRFDGWLTSGKDWRLVLVDSYSQTPGNQSTLQAYVQNGGRAWWNSWNTDSTTASVFEAVLGDPSFSPSALRRWNSACCGPQHPIYRAPSVGQIQTPNQDTCGIDGFELDVADEGVALAGDSPVPAPGQASLIAGNHGRSLIFGGTPGLYPAGEMVPLLRGAVSFLLSGYPVYTTESFGSVLRAIDPETAQTQSGVSVKLAGTPIQGGNGLAMDPLSGALFAVAARSSGRDLVRVNPDTGAASLVGALGAEFAGLAFDCQGFLYGVTGDGAGSTPESLFSLDTTNGAATLLTPLGNGDAGEALAFSPADGLLYHGSGRGDRVLETLDENLSITPIPLSGAPFSEFRALTYADPERLLLSDGSTLYDLSTSGTVTARGPLDHFAKGLANSDVHCCTDPGDADCDGQPNDQDLCPYYLEQNPGADVNGNGRGDECECGDQTLDGKVDVSDLVAINIAIFTPSLATPLCDANNDGLCNVNDIVAANAEIFSPGSTSSCARQPVPGP